MQLSETGQFSDLFRQFYQIVLAEYELKHFGRETLTHEN